MNEFFRIEHNVDSWVSIVNSEANPKKYRKLGEDPKIISNNVSMPYNFSLYTLTNIESSEHIRKQKK